tara:strand:- start:104 stop:430 length:327 start_codon:yes stop_codon:yes gene_type:complete
MRLNEDRLYHAVKGILLEEIGEERLREIEDELAEIKAKLGDLDDLESEVQKNMDYSSGLSANILDYLVTLDEELFDDPNVDVPESHEQMRILLSRKGRKKYYLSRFRL